MLGTVPATMAGRLLLTICSRLRESNGITYISERRKGTLEMKQDKNVAANAVKIQEKQNDNRPDQARTKMPQWLRLMSGRFSTDGMGNSDTDRVDGGSRDNANGVPAEIIGRAGYPLYPDESDLQ
jgi:hypothetical protein